MEIIGNFFGVEHDGSVEVGEENDEDKIDGWIEEPFGGDTVGIERAEIAGGRSGEKRNQGRAKAVFWVEGEDKLADEGGVERKAVAKMTGMTPAAMSLMGRMERMPP